MSNKLVKKGRIQSAVILDEIARMSDAGIDAFIRDCRACIDQQGGEMKRYRALLRALQDEKGRRANTACMGDEGNAAVS